MWQGEVPSQKAVCRLQEIRVTPSEIRARVRELERELRKCELSVELRKLRKRLRGSPAQVFRGPTRKQDKAAKRETARERRRRVYAEVDARTRRAAGCSLTGRSAARADP